MDKIDLIYMWVDGSDSKWRSVKNHWQQQINSQENICEDSVVEARWRDNEELKYSLRSVEKFAPWVNHIYIVTGFGQVPKWLNTKHKKITVVAQEDIMPKDSLPTFNSVAIEMCLANIPNLSEKFLLSNDDMFFNKTVGPDFFFDSQGRAIVWHTQNKKIKNIGFAMEFVESDYRKTILMAAHKIYKIFGKKYFTIAPAHNIDPYLKSSVIQCRNHPMLKRDIDSQIRNKFRTDWELQRWIFNLYDLVHGRAIFKRARHFKHRKHFIYNLIHRKKCLNAPVYCEDAKSAMQNINPPLFCINDTVRTSDEIRKQNQDFLGKKFPKKSCFEL